MTTQALQLFLALLLFVSVLGLGAERRVSRSMSWRQIVDRINTRYHHLANLSYGCIFSEGLECSEQDLWNHLGGVFGMLAIFRNVGILMNALDFLESASSSSTPLLVRIDSLRTQAGNVRIVLLTAIARQSMRHILGDSTVLAGKASVGYISFIAKMSLAVRDYYPELLPDYSRVVQQA